MTADKIAKRGTPLTDAEFDGLDNSGAELCRRLEQDRAALVEALMNAHAGFLNLAPDDVGPMRSQFVKHMARIDETLAAVRERGKRGR